MAVFKCKMCGGDFDTVDGTMNIVECCYCGTKQTIAFADNERKVSLFYRANKLRFACDFDKAATIYETIVAEYPNEAEGYWGLCLCNYGIEYVDDPLTQRKIPTCNRTSFESIFDDPNFEQTLENSDVYAREIYRNEAKEIEELRKKIIEVSSKEEPYDIFICYKETDVLGNRTVDSVIAQDVYDAFTEKGYRVFFARISLEDKIGEEYEPYIFAALNSAKVMLTFGTSFDNFNAVWVKNEWSRFLHLMEKGEKKYLVPCYKDIDAYDMPKEFTRLQAQDMGKVGAVQDLVRGVEKLIGANKTVNSDNGGKEKNKPSIIRNVCTIGSNDPKNGWPQGQYTNIIDLDKFSLVYFHIWVDKEALKAKNKITSRLEIVSENGNTVLDKSVEFPWRPNYDKLARHWVIRFADRSYIPTGNYTATLTIDDSQEFEYNITIMSSSLAGFGEQYKSEKERRRNGPSIVRNICTIGSNDPDDPWPNGTYTPNINLDEFSVMYFHATVISPLIKKKSAITTGLDIYNSDGVLVFSEESVLAWKPNYDKLARGWIIRGEDGTYTPPGDYVAEMWVENSRVFTFKFKIISKIY